MAMYGHNSTIKRKQKICKRCGLPKYIFSRGRCVDCSRIEDTQARMEEEANEEIEREGLKELIKEADDVYSKWLRLSNADKDGIVSCFICSNRVRWQDAQCAHYVKRGNLFLRWDTRNTTVQDKACNEYKDGNYREYSKKLELIHPGITDILYEEGNLVYKPTREEIRGIINEYSQKLKLLKQ